MLTIEKTFIMAKYNINETVVFNGEIDVIKGRVKEYPSQNISYKLASGAIVKESQLSRPEKKAPKPVKIIEPIEDIEDVVLKKKRTK